MIFRKHIASLTLAAVLAAAVSGPAAAQQSQRPTDMSTDEAGMWYQVDKIEEQVKTSGVRVTDPVLVDYIQKITCKVTGPDCDQIRLYVIDAGVFNASMFPNGMMLVNSGLLVRAENEAQVACVVGHEYGHFKELHSLERWRRAKSLANASIVLQIVAGSAGAGSEGQAGIGLLGLAIMQSFSREHEREADAIGFDTAAAAGYSSAQCADVWTNLISEQEASQFKKVRKRGKGINVFSSHPVPKERAKTLKQMAVKNPGGAFIGDAEHKAATSKFLGQWLRTELLAKDYDRHIHMFGQLKDRGRNAGMMNYYIGEAYRLRKKDGDREKAVEHWELAAADVGAPPEVYRSLGEHYRRKKLKDEALKAYREYLVRAPAAQDRELIQAYVTRLEKG